MYVFVNDISYIYIVVAHIVFKLVQYCWFYLHKTKIMWLVDWTIIIIY